MLWWDTAGNNLVKTILLYIGIDMEVMKGRYSILFFLPAFLICLSCDDQFDKGSRFESADRIICAEVSHLFSDNYLEDNSENYIENIGAFLFDDGRFVKEYAGVKRSENKYEFALDAMKGNLYIVANTSLIPDFSSPESGLTESQWAETVIHSADGQAEMAFTGVMSLTDYTASDNSIPVSLKRVAARFDLKIAVAGTAEVQDITFKNVQKNTYLFPKSDIVSPENGDFTDIRVVPDKPFDEDKKGILYIYEQHNTDLKVELNASIDGKDYSFETDLPENIARNTVYSLTLRKDIVDKDVQLTIEEWKDGGDTALKPGIDDRIVIDSSISGLPDNVTVANDGTMLILPHLETDFIVAIKSDSELEVFPVADYSLTVEPVSVEGFNNKAESSLAGINLFRVSKKLYPPNTKTVDLTVYFHRKGLNNSYPEDNILVRMTGNPATCEGALTFGIDSYSYDFNRYIDNEFGIFTLPPEKEMIVEFEEDEDSWIMIDNESGSNAYRVLGGWRPNDPTANGRKQSATLVIRNKADNSDREEYTVHRRNYGLPVTWLHGVWWCKYNAIKNSGDFEDQILSSSDPAAQSSTTVFQYLTSCSTEEFYNLWGWAYQGSSGQGMKVIEKDSVIVLDGFTRDEKVHINKLPPNALSPDGYELPSMEEFNRLFDATDYIWMMYNGTHTLKNPWNGHSKIKRQQLRKNGIQIGSMTISDIIYIAMSSPDFPEHEPLVWYGPAAQWNDTGILHSGHYNNILFGVYSPTGEGWYMNGGMANLYMMKNGASSFDTRILRFKKSDVEYIY